MIGYGSYLIGNVSCDPLGSMTGTNRLIRGGSWGDVAAYCRAANRTSNQQSEGCPDFGLRLALVPFSPAKPVAEPESDGTEGVAEQRP